MLSYIDFEVLISNTSFSESHGVMSLHYPSSSFLLMSSFDGKVNNFLSRTGRVCNVAFH